MAIPSLRMFETFRFIVVADEREMGVSRVSLDDDTLLLGRAHFVDRSSLYELCRWVTRVSVFMPSKAFAELEDSDVVRRFEIEVSRLRMGLSLDARHLEEPEDVVTFRVETVKVEDVPASAVGLGKGSLKKRESV